MKKFGLSILVLLAVAGVGLGLTTQKQQVDVTDDAALIAQLDSISLLMSNAWRPVTEYDERDESADPLLWSKKKTEAVLVQLAEELLNKRRLLKQRPNLNNVAYQGRVRQWNMYLGENQNGYRTILDVLWRVSGAYSGVHDLLKSEVSEALRIDSSAEALWLVLRLADNSWVRNKVFAEYLPLFEGTIEYSALEWYMLMEQYRVAASDKDRLTEKNAEEWIARTDQLDQKLREVEHKLKGTVYADLKAGDYPHYTALYAPMMEAEMPELMSRQVKVELWGVVLGDWELVCSDKRIKKISSSKKQFISAEVLYQLPGIDRYMLCVKPVNSADCVGRVRSFNTEYLSVRLEKIDGAYYLLATSQADGSPVSGVVGQVMKLYRDQVIGRATTDKEGMVKVQPQPKPGEALTVAVEHPGLISRSEFYMSQPEKPLFSDVEARTSVDFYPDRSIYRRGQKVQMGLLVRRGKGAEQKLVAKHKGAAKLYAQRNHEEELVQEVAYVTDRHGLGEVRFELPKDPSLTNYQVRTDSDDRFYLNVQDYKLNYLSVRVDSIPTGQTIGQKMKVYGHVEDLNGFPVVAELELSYDNGKKLETRSGEDGLFELETAAISKQVSWNGQYMSLRATDPLGNVAVERISLPKDSVSLPVNAWMLDGVYEKSAVDLSLKTQPYGDLPLGDLSRYTIRATLVDRAGKEIELGELNIHGSRVFDLSHLPSGYYGLRLESVDYFGQKICSESEEGIYLYAKDDQQIFEDDNPLFVHRESEQTLIASSYPLTVTLTKQMGRGKKSIERLKLERRKIARIPHDSRVTVLSVSTFYEGERYGQDVRFVGESSRDDGLLIRELSDEPDTSYLPGARYDKELLILDTEGQPYKDVPLLVTVYDVALDDAGGALDWPSVARRLPEPELVMDESMMLFGARALSLSAVAQKSDNVKESAADAVVEEQPTRRNFAETAYFSALLKSDERGRVQLSFPLPDSQTTFVVLGYSYTPDLELDGMYKDSLQVFAPASIELSMPRYLRYGDTLQGTARIANRTEEPFSAHYQIMAGDSTLADGTITVDARSHQFVPFTFIPTESLGDSIALSGSLSGTGVRDRVERKLALISDQEEYTVGIPFTAYRSNAVDLTLPKSTLATEAATLEVYFSPLNLLFSELAKSYGRSERAIKEMNLIEAATEYSVLAQLRNLMAQQPDVTAQLRAAIPQLESVDDGAKSLRSDRQASAGELARFYSFVTSERQLRDRLAGLDCHVRSFAVPTGGFRYGSMSYEPSPWLTHHVLSLLGKHGQKYFSPELNVVIQKSIAFLKQKIGTEEAFCYNDYVGLALLLHEYGDGLDHLSESQKEEYTRQVSSLRAHYQTAFPSALIRYAWYARYFESEAQWQSVRAFIQDRLHYTRSDMERLMLELFMSKNEEPVGDETIRFMLGLKQGTLWSSPFFLDAVEVLSEHTVAPAFTSDARLVINGEEHPLTPYELAMGQAQVRLPERAEELRLRWQGIKTDILFGGVTYQVAEKASEATATGQKLKVTKEVYARRVVSDRPELVRLSDVQAALQGEKLLVRYFVETEQDLSLVTISDTRIAGAEPGYDFSGYGVSDRLFWCYTRRESTDHIYIDYLPRGKHVLELEAVANVRGHYSYGPAQIQSIYAPEYAGNSAGGAVEIKQK